MPANATPAAITEKVNRYLEMGFTTVGPPADIYPPARMENIEAFVKAILEYKVSWSGSNIFLNRISLQGVKGRAALLIPSA